MPRPVGTAIGSSSGKLLAAVLAVETDEAGDTFEYESPTVESILPPKLSRLGQSLLGVMDAILALIFGVTNGVRYRPMMTTNDDDRGCSGKTVMKGAGPVAKIVAKIQNFTYVRVRRNSQQPPPANRPSP